MENQITGRYIKWVVITFLGNRNYIDGPSEGCVWKNDLDCDLPGNGNARRVFFNAWKCDETEIFNDFSGKWILNQIKGLKLSHSMLSSRETVTSILWFWRQKFFLPISKSFETSPLKLRLYLSWTHWPIKQTILHFHGLEKIFKSKIF